MGKASKYANRLSFGEPRGELFCAQQHITIATGHQLQIVTPEVPVPSGDRLAEGLEIMNVLNREAVVNVFLLQQ